MARPELAVQVKIIRWMREAIPGAIIHHSVNEHSKRGKAGMLQAVRNKHAGMLGGFPDLIVLPAAEIGPFFLEVKAPKGRVSDAQKHVHHMLTDNGYPVAVVRSVEDVQAFLEASAIPFKDIPA